MPPKFSILADITVIVTELIRPVSIISGLKHITMQNISLQNLKLYYFHIVNVLKIKTKEIEIPDMQRTIFSLCNPHVRNRISVAGYHTRNIILEHNIRRIEML